MARNSLAAAGGIGSGQGSLVLDVERDEPQITQAPVDNQAKANLLANLTATRADLVERIARLHADVGTVDHGLAGLLARIQGAIAAVQAEGGGDG